MLSREQLNDLAFDVMAEWWLTAVQALVDKAGEEKAIEAATPYLRNAGASGGLIIKRTLGITESGARADVATKFFGGSVLRMTGEGDWEIHEKGSKATLISCPFETGSPEACKMFCDIMGCAQTETISDGLKCRVPIKMTEGHDHCCYIAFEGDSLDDLGSIISHVTVADYPRDFPEELLDDFAAQYLGEIWTLPVKAMVDLFGSEEAIKHLSRYMKARGMETGLKLSRICNLGDKMEAIQETLACCNEMFHQEGTRITGKESMEREITSCPWSDSSPEVCKAIESFLNGVVEAIDPECSFAYDQMKTRGDKKCHWIIREKGAVSEIRQTPSDSDETKEMLKALKWRFARGEITEEEYKRHRQLLEG